jgi:hypothetical protein
MTSVHVHIWYYAWDTRGYFIKPLTNIFDFSEQLRKQAKQYVSKDNLLYYVSAKGENRRVVREAEKHRILRACHSDSTADKYIFYVIIIQRNYAWIISYKLVIC